MESTSHLAAYITQLLPNHQADKKLAQQALTHKSHAMDFKHHVPHNERLEFLGDAVLDTVIAQQLYHDFPTFSEAQLTLYKITLVREETLALAARNIDLNQHILISTGEERSGGREKKALLADCFEAVIGYFFLTEGYVGAQQFVLSTVYTLVDNIDQLMPIKSYKARVQEYTQKTYKNLPVYEDVALEVEPSGNVLSYQSTLTINNKHVSTGIAASKKKSQEAAAKAFRENMKNK